MPYLVRNLRESDIGAYTEFYNATTEPDRRIDEDKALKMTFLDPSYSPERHFIAVDEKGRIEADCRADMNRNYMEANGPVSGIVLHYRKKEAADLVLEAAAEYLEAQGIERATTWVQEKSPVREYLKERGFRIVRRFLVMSRKPERTEVHIPEGYSLRAARFPEEERTFMDLINSSFRGHFGWYEMDESDFRRRYMLPEEMDRSGFYMAFNRDGEPAGVVASYIKNESTGDMRGLGVLPEHRNKGLGRALAAASLNFFAEKGIEKVTLGVDSRNLHALAIYEELGFGEDYGVLVVEANVESMLRITGK